MAPWDKESSICWDCANACRKGCSWSESFTPVDGWEAEHIVDEEKNWDSYRVISCPLFVHDTPENRIRDLNTEGCIRLLEQLMKITREDYINTSKLGTDESSKLHKEIERWIRGKGASRLHMIADPEKVIRELKKAELAEKKRKAQLRLVKG